MLNSAEYTKRNAFLAAIERAREEGLSPAEMASMITAATEPQRPANGVHPTEPDDVMYEPGSLPEGLIDLPSASKKYGIPVKTLRSWIYLGKLPKRGRLKARAPGGGYIVTVEADIEYCRDHPRKRGRKKNTAS